MADNPIKDRLDRLDSRIQSLRWVVRAMARRLGMDWQEVTRQARVDMDADEEKRSREARSKEAPDA